MYTAIRTHHFEMAHRLVEHPGACARIHGHSYKLEIEVCPKPVMCDTREDTYFRPDGSIATATSFCAPVVSRPLNNMGMVMDFGEIKQRICQWIDNNWDHRMMLWELDPILAPPCNLVSCLSLAGIGHSVVVVPFNPTAENMAEYLLNHVGPHALGKDSPVEVVAITLHETSKCRVRVTKEP